MSGRYTPPKRGGGSDDSSRRRSPTSRYDIDPNETAEEKADRLKKEQRMRRIALAAMAVIFLANVVVAIVYTANVVTFVAVVLSGAVLGLLIRMDMAARKAAADDATSTGSGDSA